MIDQITETVAQERLRLKRELRQRTMGYITAAFGLVAGLAWNEAITSMITYLIPLEKSSMWAKFLYALIITLILVLVTSHLTRVLGEDDEPKA